MDSSCCQHDACRRRGLAEQLFSSYQAQRLADALELPEGVAGISAEPERTRMRIEELGLGVRGGIEQPQVDTEERPRPSRLVSLFLRDTMYRQWAAGIYPLYSSIAHGTHYGLIRAYRDQGKRVEGEKVFDRQLDQREMDAAAGIAMASFIVLLNRVVRVMGWGRISVDMYENRVRRLLERPRS
jgi:hypothetical protein